MACYIPLYFYGVIHGDPHLGNYSVRDDGTINLLDFGCIRVFKPAFVRGVIDLYKALRDNDSDLAVHAYETWGIKDLTFELVEILNLWAEFVYAPLLEDRVRPIQENTGQYGAEVAQKVREELNRIGGIAPPPEFVLMDRAAIGLGSVFTHLKAEGVRVEIAAIPQTTGKLLIENADYFHEITKDDWFIYKGSKRGR